MHCEKVREALSHGEGSDWVHEQVRQHVAGCPECRRFAEGLRRIEEWLAADTDLAPPPGLGDRIGFALTTPLPLPFVPDREGRIRNVMPRILVVDDEPNIVRLVQVNLERHGYRVETANNGAQALNRIRESRPDLLVSDVMMPEMSGFELLKTLKMDAELSSLPVIMLTAKANDTDVMAGWQYGADMYLTKPFNPVELLQFVRRILAAEEEDRDAYRI
jgi:two-component system alkaline phosphatase synthesis response regulator PhoP/two-component system response regulator VicR